ncbi:hypothetical protein EVC45_39445 [Paraburkholderia sp. UYCP14C]|uniref:hypothetical protein n=1 Tax=Paraburkholderia sp. UYCP14C TaxID=2511130 RepID=UPI00102095F1|nr:hypothetical protein [Paraburkholderia sp. UYCP14C]RZF24337.1 hypothetical protein EVC45_39445 [Paraburkholderia sp. UYCP14C]
MGFDRTYSREEIHQMLCLSERRMRPSSKPKTARQGHPISGHTEQREDPFDRRHIRQDSTFVSRKDLVLAVEEALHHEIGQQKLATLNDHNVSTCSITVQLAATLGKIRANVVRNPMAMIGNKDVPAQGPQHYTTLVPVNSVFVLVDKLAEAEAWAPLHIHTAFPKDCAV